MCRIRAQASSLSESQLPPLSSGVRQQIITMRPIVFLWCLMVIACTDNPREVIKASVHTKREASPKCEDVLRTALSSKRSAKADLQYLSQNARYDSCRSMANEILKRWNDRAN